MEEHGTFEMEVINQTLIVRCFGAWNLETVLRMCKEYKVHVQTISDRPWACLVDLSKWELSTPEMWDEIAELNEWGNINNQRYEAVICCLSLQRMLMEDSHKVLTNVETNFCDDIEAAYTWLNSVGVLDVAVAHR